jgi:ABC-type xylose transport system substrate-binding protein
LGGRGRQISEFEASLVYRVSSRTARAIQRNPVLKQQQQQQQQQQQKQKQTNKETTVIILKRDTTAITEIILHLCM